MKKNSEGLPEQFANHLAEVRERRGLSAAEMAAQAGISRQTIYAIEANNYMPNTALALRLARLLEVSVEDLFHLDTTGPLPSQATEVELILNGAAWKPGQPVQLCRVGKSTMAVPSSPVPIYLPIADGAIVSRSANGKSRANAIRFQREPSPNHLLLAGCDPAMSVLAAYAGRTGVQLSLASCNSSRALELLKKGRVHIAGTHLRDTASGESNLPVIRKLFTRDSVSVITFASWQQGFVVAPGNPKKIHSAADLVRVRLVNREAGAGSRLVLDRELKKAGIKPRDVSGYDRVAWGHLPAAWQVVSGIADCCVATEAAARAFGLGFIPIGGERFDLVIPRELVGSPSVQRLLETMQRSAFRRELEILSGYDTAKTGQVVSQS